MCAAFSSTQLKGTQYRPQDCYFRPPHYMYVIHCDNASSGRWWHQPPTLWSWCLGVVWGRTHPTNAVDLRVHIIRSTLCTCAQNSTTKLQVNQVLCVLRFCPSVCARVCMGLPSPLWSCNSVHWISQKVVDFRTTCKNIEETLAYRTNC